MDQMHSSAVTMSPPFSSGAIREFKLITASTLAICASFVR
jgi:hypothetical protein